MGLFDSLFDTNSGDELFRKETAFLVDTGIQILRRESEGGFIKIFISGKDDEIGINLSETPLLRDMKQLRYSLEQIIAARYGLDEEIISRFLSMTKLYVEQEYTYDDWVAFVHHYSEKTSKSNCRKWLISYMKAKHPDLKIEDGSKYVSIMV